MRRNKWLLLLSLFLIPSLLIIMLADLAGVFSYSDMPFALTIFIYCIFVFLQKSSSKVAFLLSMYFLLLMGLSFIPTGSSIITERFGEWFFIFFVMGLTQYGLESWQVKKN